MRPLPRLLTVCSLALVLGTTPACGGAQSNSGDSSKGSGDSSRGSGDSSQNSGDSSKDSTRGSTDGSTEGTSGKDGTNVALTTTLVGVTALGVGAVILTARKDEDDLAAGPELERARRYLQAHRRAIAIDLSRGAGPLVSDVAMTLRLSEAHLPAVARALRTHREALLLPLADDQVTVEDTLAFGRTLLAAVRSDPELAPLVAAAPTHP